MTLDDLEGKRLRTVQPAKVAIVLLSGGLDSVAALHHTLARGLEICALGFDYGQPHRDQELGAAGIIAKRLGVPFHTRALADAITGARLLGARAGVESNGVSRSNVPGRNAVFLTSAANFAAVMFPGAFVEIVIGCNADDARAFPDCRADFLKAASDMLRAAHVGTLEHVFVRAPWLATSKADVVRWAETEGHGDDARASVSCYRGTRCGKCDACTLRAAAFASVGIADGTGGVTITGGDTSRASRMGVA